MSSGMDTAWTPISEERLFPSRADRFEGAKLEEKIGTLRSK
jgi:hypothetical protein